MSHSLFTHKLKALPSEVHQFLQLCWPLEQIKCVKKLQYGLNNKNYLIQVNEAYFVLKYYQKSLPQRSLVFQSSLRKRTANTQVVQLWQKELNCALFPYIKECEWANNRSDVFDIFETLSNMHSAPKGDLMDYIDIRESLINIDANYKRHYHSQWRDCVVLLSQFPSDLGCCHNDLVRDNFIFSENGFVLIDFEYAGVGDIYFDLAATACSFRLNKEEQKQALLNYYSNSNQLPPSYAIDKLKAYKLAYLLLSIAWYEERGEAEHAASLISQLRQNDNF